MPSSTAALQYGRQGGRWLPQQKGPACAHATRVKTDGGPLPVLVIHEWGVAPVLVADVPIRGEGRYRLEGELASRLNDKHETVWTDDDGFALGTVRYRWEGLNGAI